MTVSIDSSLLTSYYQSKIGLQLGSTGSGASSLLGGGAKQYAPTAPWKAGHGSTDTSAAVQRVLGGQKFINENAAKLDLPGASEDYRKLFALYNGLNTLYGLTQKADTKGATDSEIAHYAKIFENGLSQVADYASSLKLDQMRLTVGQTMLNDRSTTGAPLTKYDYVTQTLATGATSDPVAAFAGDAAFDMQVKRGTVSQTLHFDLSEMGSQTRSMANVVNYFNSKLQDAGLTTKFAINRTTAQPRTVQVGNQTVKLPAVGDAMALEIKADSAEQVTFSAAARTAVYVATQSGDPDPDKNVKTADGVIQNQILKIDPGAATLPETRVDTTTLPGTVSAVRATQVGADGSVYMLADIKSFTTTAKTDSAGKTTVTETPTDTNGQTIQGDTDVMLLKYDSAGHLMYSRTLGAADNASGLGLAVAGDGRVAVVGSVTGGLTGATNGPLNSSDTSGKSDSFVTLYDASGVETWTVRRGAQDNDQATAVAFGADGVVYVAGQTKGSLPNGGSLGGKDSYLVAYATDSKGTPKALFTQQFGTAGDDKPTGLVVDGNTVYVAGAEDGHAVVRSFQTANTVTETVKQSHSGTLTITTNTYTDGALTNTASTDYPAGSGPDATTTSRYTSAATVTAGAVRDLGDLTGGSVAGLVLEGGKLYLAGQTRNGALGVANTTRAYDDGMDGFAAAFSTDLADTSQDNLAYYGGAGNSTVSAMTVSGGKVWITGSAGADLPGQTMTGKAQGYIAALDVTTGDVSGVQLLSGKDGIATATSIAVDASGASDLDVFGLPHGLMTYAQSANVVANSAVRPGDQFQIRTRAGGTPTTITIAADDTYTTLAAKIRSAAGFQAKVEVLSNGTLKTLKISPINDNYTVEILPGKPGKNALPALGLAQGVARNTKINDDGKSVSTAPGGNVYGLGLDTALTISDKESLSHAQSVLQAALTKIKNAYQDLVTQATPKSAQPKTNAGGAVPAYLQAQIANYQAGLDRLVGGG